jgi:hypothetical protein
VEYGDHLRRDDGKRGEWVEKQTGDEMKVEFLYLSLS